MTDALLNKVWAICDHFQGESGSPVTTNILKRSTGVTRSDLRKLVRDKKLVEFTVTNERGSSEKAYFRPKRSTCTMV